MSSPSEVEACGGIDTTPTRWSRQTSPMGGQNLTTEAMHGWVQGTECLVGIVSSHVRQCWGICTGGGAGGFCFTDHWIPARRATPCRPGDRLMRGESGRRANDTRDRQSLSLRLGCCSFRPFGHYFGRQKYGTQKEEKKKEEKAEPTAEIRLLISPLHSSTLGTKRGTLTY